MSKHTPGPWRWEYSAKSKSVILVGGWPKFDKTVMQFGRWGMNGASPLFNTKITGCLWDIMERPSDQPNWIAPFEGREHHADWCANLVHPDAVLMAAAPDLLEACEELLELVNLLSPVEVDTHRKARRALAKAGVDI